METEICHFGQAGRQAGVGMNLGFAMINFTQIGSILPRYISVCIRLWPFDKAF